MCWCLQWEGGVVDERWQRHCHASPGTPCAGLHELHVYYMIEGFERVASSAQLVGELDDGGVVWGQW
eukprot:3924235-Amphidinium_carterae.1